MNLRIQEEFRKFKINNNIFDSTLSKVLFLDKCKDNYSESEMLSVIGKLEINFVNNNEAYNYYIVTSEIGSEMIVIVKENDYLLLESCDNITMKKDDLFFKFDRHDFSFFEPAKEKIIENFYSVKHNGNVKFYYGENNNQDNIFIETSIKIDEQNNNRTYYFENHDKINQIYMNKFHNRIHLKSNLISFINLDEDSLEIESLVFSKRLLDMIKEVKDKDFIEKFEDEIKNNKYKTYQEVYDFLNHYKDLANLLFDKKLNILDENIEPLKNIELEIEKFNKIIKDYSFANKSLYTEEELLTFNSIYIRNNKIMYKKEFHELEKINGSILFESVLKDFINLRNKILPEKINNIRELKNGI